jgi:ADP-ribose pyrophosphatase YjhB (NUDIX family)
MVKNNFEHIIKVMGNIIIAKKNNNLDIVNNSIATKCGVILLYFDNTKNEWYTVMIHQNASNFWGFPKGSIEKNENKFNCALRELKQETGISFNYANNVDLEKNMIKYKPIDYSGQLYFVVKVKNKIDLTRKKIKDKNEISDLKWINLIDLVKNDEKTIKSSTDYKSIKNRDRFTTLRSSHTHHIIKSLLLDLKLIKPE